MIVTYTQDNTYSEKTAESTKPIPESVYGMKLGAEAYAS